MVLTRKLAYKDRYVVKLDQEIQDACTDYNPEFLELNETQTIIMELTGQQWTEIFSALMTGADLTYPERSHEIVWNFSRWVECMVSFCQKMIDCFNSNEATREAMIQATITELLDDAVLAESFVSAMAEIGLATSQGNTNTGMPYSGLLSKQLSTGCDINELYGKCFSAVGALDTVSRDVLEVIEVLTNDVEITAMIADNIPAIGALPASIAETATWLQDYVTEIYLSDFNTTVQEFWACKLFCFAMNNGCSFTLGDIRDIYLQELTTFNPPDPTENLATFIDWFVGLITLDPTETIGAMHLFIMEIFIRSGSVFGQNFRILEIELQTAEPIAPLCDCCVDLLFTFDVQEGVAQTFSQTTLAPSWSSNGWTDGSGCWVAGSHQFSPPNSASRFSWIKIAVPADCIYSGFSIDLYSSGYNSSNLTVALYDAVGDVNQSTAGGYFASAVDIVPNPDGTRTMASSFTGQTMALGYVIVGFGTGGGTTGTIKIKNFQLT